MEKLSRSTKSDDAKPEVMRVFSIQLPTNVSDWVERVASAKGLTAEQQLGELITERARRDIEPLDVQLRRVNQLIKEIVVMAKKTPMQEEKDAKTGKPAFHERKKKRDHLIELSMQAYEELSKITKSERAAKEAEVRLQAFTVMARVGLFNAAIIRDQEVEDISRLIEEIREENDKFDAKIKELEKEKREEEAAARAALV